MRNSIIGKTSTIRKTMTAFLLVLVVAACNDVAAPETELSNQAQACENENNATYEALLACVSPEGVQEHLVAFQEIADANGGLRASGTRGYTQSVQYVAGLLEDAGYDVTLEPFRFNTSTPIVELQQTAPTRAPYATDSFTGSATGDVAGRVVSVDLALEEPTASTSGCEAGDFSGLNLSGSSDIALIQRGACTFAAKAQNAQAAGAEAVIIFNQGNAGRQDLTVGTLGTNAGVSIPVVGASFADGVALAQAGAAAQVRVLNAGARTDFNIIAELPGANEDNVVMAGAHLDSVRSGPGINDNGSGSAAILEVALAMSQSQPENTLRFAWWGAEELGLIGSTSYVNSLSQSELDRIALYLNFDMVGSPNYIFQVYDADQSSFRAPVRIPPGSVALENTLESFYTLVGQPYDDTAFSGRSDYQAFIRNGIPSSGLFTGAETRKTRTQASIWGGSAGVAFDPCYHAACDDLDNLDLEALDINSDAIAFAMLTYAYSTEDVNGVPGRAVPGNLDIPAPDGPQGTFTVGNVQRVELDHAHSHYNDHKHSYGKDSHSRAVR